MATNIEEKDNLIKYTYNSNNLPIEINTNGNSITYEYNDNGTLTKQCDPNSGCTTMEYTAINELIKSTDAKGSIYTYTYDNLGKLIQKTGINNTVYSYEYYETNLQPDLGLPKTQTLTVNGVVKNKIDYTYNSLAELTQTQELAANNITYTTTYNYTDNLGKHRLNSVNYPNIELTYDYDNNNNLQVIGDGNQPFIWTKEEEAIDGRPLLIKYGNNFKTEYTYDNFLSLASIKSNHVNIPNNVAMHAGYTFDIISKNLLRKDDIKNANHETFEYDNLDRLTKSTVFLLSQSPVDFEVNYDNNGNITQKVDAGTFDYTGTKPHAVQSNSFLNTLSPVIIPTTFAEPQVITYTQSNKIATLTQGTKDLTINYGFNEQRIHTQVKDYSLTTTEIFYISTANMEIVNGAEITYLYANVQPFAYHKKEGSEQTINYLHLDYQGSIMAVTTQTGTLKEEYNYDAWGRARNPQKLYYTSLNPFGSGNDIRRGYTFHEHLEEFNLINMNGRVYDPLLARFLNADPLIQDNTDAQNYNRYSYVLNNPTKYTDPSGYAYNGIGSSYRIGGVSDAALENTNHEIMMGFDAYWGEFFNTPREQSGGPSSGGGVNEYVEGASSGDNDPVDPPIVIGGQPFSWPANNSDVKPTRTSGVVNTPKQPTVNWYTPAGKINAVFGIAASTIEVTDGSFRLSTTTKGFSPKYYGTGWTGSQYAKTFNISKIGNSLGKFSFGLGVVIDIRGMMIYKNNPNSPNAVHPAKAGVNTVMGAYGLWVNPLGGSLYFAVDNFYPGGWPGALQNNGNLIEQNQRILGPGWNLYKDF